MRINLYFITPKTSDWAFDLETYCAFQFNVKQCYVLQYREVGVSTAESTY